mgnify:CR=1 FL=1
MRHLRSVAFGVAVSSLAAAVWVKAQAAPERPGADQAELVAFYESGAYQAWPRDVSIRPTGPFVDGVDYSTHGNVRIFYSPDVVAWLKAGRPEGGIPDGAVIYKIHYPTGPDAPNKDTPTGFAAMVRTSGSGLLSAATNRFSLLAHAVGMVDSCCRIFLRSSGFSSSAAIFCISAFVSSP